MIPSKDLKFSQKTIESIGHYVYALVDPRNGQIFYVGEGYENRVFDHEMDARDPQKKSAKLDTIRAIKMAGQNIEYYILRHGLQKAEMKDGEDVALTVESAFINFLSCSKLNKGIANLTNIQSGHHQFEEGIMTVDEIETFYNCPECTADIVKENGHKLICININKTYPEKHDVYEAVRKRWYLSKAIADSCDFVVAEYRGIVRGVFKVRGEWQDSGIRSGKNGQIVRYQFEGDEVLNSPYLNTRLLPERDKGSRNPVRYIGVGF